MEGDDKGRQWLKDYAAKKQLTWPQAPTTAEWYGPPFEQYDVRYLPFSLLLDREGRVIDVNPHGRKRLDAAVAEALGTAE